MKATRTTLHSLLAAAAGMLFLASTAAVTAQVQTIRQDTTHRASTSRSRSKRER